MGAYVGGGSGSGDTHTPRMISGGKKQPPVKGMPPKKMPAKKAMPPKKMPPKKAGGM